MGKSNFKFVLGVPQVVACILVGLIHKSLSTGHSQQSTAGHHDTDKKAAPKVSPSANLFTECPSRSRGIFVV